MNADLGSFAVQSGHLRAEAAEWTSRAGGLRGALGLLTQGSGRGGAFGVQASLAGVSAQHDRLVESMITAIDDGIGTFGFLDAALVAAADAYDGSDATSAASTDAIVRRLER